MTIIFNDGTKVETLANQKQDRFHELGDELIDLGLACSKERYSKINIDLTVKGLNSIISKLIKLRTLQEENNS